MDLKVLCRTCAQNCESSKVNLFSKPSEALSDLNFLTNGYLKSANTRDQLPKWVCQKCLKLLSEATNFLKQVIKAHNDLIELKRNSSESYQKTRNKKIITKLPSPEPHQDPESIEFIGPEASFQDEENLESEEEESKENPPQKPQFICTQCNRSFTRKFRLKAHQRIHTGERPYPCNECDQSFRQLNALKCHQRTHTGEKPYECSFCKKKFSQLTILKTHLTIHTGKTVSCTLCDKKFSRPSYLIQHQREHTGERPYVCHICPASYKQKSHLDHHLSGHSGIKFPCEICGKRYSKKWSLKVHMFTHMGESKLPHPCLKCTKAFAIRSKLVAHVRAKHQEGEAPDPSNTVEVETGKGVQIVRVPGNEWKLQ